MDEMVSARILGLGHQLPERVVTNHDLTRLMDTSEEWIEQRTGIRERRFIEAGASGADLGALAAREAAEAARLPRERVVATAEAAGHIAAAGIPIALADAVAAGRVGKGDLVCGVAFGAGMSWGGGLLRL